LLSPTPILLSDLGFYRAAELLLQIFRRRPLSVISGAKRHRKDSGPRHSPVALLQAIRVEDISEAGLYHFTNKVRGTLLIDDAEDLARRNSRKFNLSVVRGGYKKKGGVLRLYQGKLASLSSFGLKAFANTNIGGVYDKALRSRFIEMKTVEAEEELERFSITLHGKELKKMASGIERLFKRKSIQKKIESLHRSFPRVTGLAGRDLELWIGTLVLAQLIADERMKSTTLYDTMLKIAIAMTEKLQEDASSLDWDIQFLLSLYNYVCLKNYDGSYYLPADEVAGWVRDEVKPPFPMRTESFGRKWDKESLITRGYISGRDENKKLVHKRAWKIDVKRLERRVEKYRRFLPTPEELEQLEQEERERMVKDLEKDAWGNLSEEERRKALGEIGKPNDWDD